MIIIVQKEEKSLSRRERKRKAEMTFVRACSNASRLEGKVCRIGSREAIPGVSRSRILSWRRNGGRLTFHSFNLELFSLFHFQFNSFIETSHSIWGERVLHQTPSSKYEARKENYLRKPQMFLGQTSNHCYDKGLVKWKWRGWIVPYWLQVKHSSESVLCFSSDKTTFKTDFSIWCVVDRAS